MEHILPKKVLERVEVITVEAPPEVILAKNNNPEVIRNKNYQTAMNFGMGFGMGMFIGTIMPTVHFLISGVGLKGKGKQILGAGTAFGSIFAFGSLLRA